MSNLSAPYFHDRDAARAHLEKIRWPDGPVCPHCGEAERIYQARGRNVRPGVKICGNKNCRKQFTVTVGTLFEGSHVPLNKWFQAAYLLCSSKKGMSSHQLHRILGVTYKTAWFMTHRLREAMKEGPIFKEPMGGEGVTVEADETYLGGKRRRVKRPDGKQHGMHTKMKVVTLVEREGRARSFVVKSVTSKTIRDVLVQNVRRESRLMTDEANFYRYVGKEFADHGRVHHAAHEYVRDDVHTNVVEGYFSIFKRGMRGVYQHCKERHLGRYLGEFDFRFNTRDFTDLARTFEALGRIGGKRLMYRHS